MGLLDLHLELKGLYVSSEEVLIGIKMFVQME